MYVADFSAVRFAYSEDAARELFYTNFTQNVHGYFALPGLTDRPYNFSVTSISTGKSYSMRSVEVRQPQIPTPVPNTAPDELEKLKDPCFVAICSFKKDEVSLTEHQLVSQLSKKYGVVIAGKSPEDHGIAPGIDAPW